MEKQLKVNRSIQPGLTCYQWLVRTARKHKSDECLIWPFGKFVRGYGQVRINGRNERVHAVSYKEFVGPVPNGIWVLHKCDNPSCFNPRHLFLGTALDNNRDMVHKGRHIHGITHHQHRLTEEQVREIRKHRKYYTLTIAACAKKYGVSMQTIKVIQKRKGWTHI